MSTTEIIFLWRFEYVVLPKKSGLHFESVPPSNLACFKEWPLIGLSLKITV